MCGRKFTYLYSFLRVTTLLSTLKIGRTISLFELNHIVAHSTNQRIPHFHAPAFTGEPITRPYTAVCDNLLQWVRRDPSDCTLSLLTHKPTALSFLIKIYPDGQMTPFLDKLIAGNVVVFLCTSWSDFSAFSQTHYCR